MTVHALSFDLDGTLYRVHRLRVAWRLRHDRALLLAFTAAREQIRRGPSLGDADALLEREAELVAPALGLSLLDAKTRVAQLRALLPDALTLGSRPFRGVKSALLGAHRSGLQLAVLSDYAPVEKLRWLGLSHVPCAATIGCDELGLLKPQPRAFLVLAERLGMNPSEILHIGDREDLDVVGALSVGLRAWRFSRRPASTRAERIFSAYTPDLFRSLVG